MLRTATPATVRKVGRDPRLRLENSTSGAIASRRFMACAFCLAEKLRRSGSATSGREANSLDWFGSERSARAVQSGPDSSGCLRNFSCASTGKDDNAYSRTRLPFLLALADARTWSFLCCAFHSTVRIDQPVNLATSDLLIQVSVNGMPVPRESHALNYHNTR